MQRNTPPSFLKSLSSLFKPSFADRASAKDYLCRKYKLSPADADQELLPLMDIEAGLLCRFYRQGLRGTDISTLKNEYGNFLKIITDFLYPTGTLDAYFYKTLSELMSNHVAPIDALRFLLDVGDQQPEPFKARMATLTNKHGMATLDAIKLLGGLNEETARDMLANKDKVDIIELRMVESPTLHMSRH